MTELRRFSSRRQRLDHAFLNQKLRGAHSYRRIAGYFRSSIFELVGEEIADIPRVQVVCGQAVGAVVSCGGRNGPSFRPPQPERRPLLKHDSTGERPLRR